MKKALKITFFKLILEKKNFALLFVKNSVQNGRIEDLKLKTEPNSLIYWTNCKIIYKEGRGRRSRTN